MVANFSINVEFSDSYFKKLGLTKDASYEKELDKAVKHTLHDAENICRREAPIRTGNLRQSIHKKKTGKCQGVLMVHGAPYWIYVQSGTSRMSPNPFVTRTAYKLKKKLPEYIMEELQSMGVFDA